MSACLLCDLDAAPPESVVYRDDDWSCEVAPGWDVPGWYFLRLRRHAEGWGGLTAREAAGFGVVTRRLAVAIEHAADAAKVYVLSFGESFPHFHVLIAARPDDLAPEFRGPAMLSLRDEHRDLEAALDVGARVRAAVGTGGR
jgi:diadenosine tetraphosphate (Ap4A) HIT family hydrolase